MSSKRRSPDRKDLRTRSGNGATKLRMDSRPQQPRITDPSLPAGRKREIDTVMKKARSTQNSNGYWDKKLLEVEAKDPNRWRHSGYKQLYVGGSSSPSPPRQRRRSRSRTRSRTRSRSRSFRRSPPVRSRPRSPLPSRRGLSPAARRPSPAPRHRPRSPSTVSSCSDDSCSVCEPSTRRGSRSRRSRSRSYSVPRSRHKNRRPSKSSPPRSSHAERERDRSRGRRPPVSPPNASLRRTGKDPRKQPPPRVRPAPVRPAEVVENSPTNDLREKKKKKDKRNKERVLLTRIKTERTAQQKKRRQSPTVAESSGSEDSSSSELSAVVASTRLTLSERFGKMAQWSVDRREMENMRITKNSLGGDLKVMIEQEQRLYDSPPMRYSHSPAPIGHFPDELMATGPSGLAAWDDVRVRYQYYKDLGYLRDLTLDDYIKWEQWWYKYQEWLKNERYYERWLESQNRNRRRKRLPVTQRLN